MFLGVSKNIGGFRVGVGTRISGRNKGPTNRELNSAEFSAFMKKVQAEINTAVATIIEANGYDFNQLQKENADLNEVFSENEDYKEFISIFESSKLNIDKVLFSGDNGVVAKRTITDELFKIKEFINKTYPGFTPTVTNIPRTKKRKVGLILGFGILIMPYIFSWFTLRKGHTKKARVIAFLWLTFALLVGLAQEKTVSETESTQEVLSATEENKTLIAD